MKKKIILFVAGFLLVLDIFVWQEVFHINSNRYLEINFFDVGQGDSAFIETPQGHQILIDGGPGSAVLEKLARNMPFWDRSIDLVILTHPEKDHMQGLLDVLQKYKIDYFLWTGVARDDAENKKLVELLGAMKDKNNSWLAALSGKATKVVAVKAGQEIKLDNVLLDVVFPLDDLSGKELKSSSNNSSVVVRLIYKNKSFLFTGDIDEAAEKELTNYYGLTSLRSDVLKVAHHGSKYSSSDAFLEVVEPEISVISVGQNSYGHPTSETLQRLEKFGIKVLRTDVDHDIKLMSDGNNININ